MRILEVAHANPATSPGGAEISALNLRDALRDIAGAEVLLAAAAEPSTIGNPHTQLGWEDDPGVALVASATDWSFMSWRSPEYARNWSEILRNFQPDVIHLHHVAQVGVELPMVAKMVLPGVPVAVTTHEFLTMCPRSGQMLDRDGGLCTSANARKCARCMEWGMPLAASRTHYVKSCLRSVDWFISPSHFVRERLAVDMIPPERSSVIPNATPARVLVPRKRESRDPLKLAYLGQHTPTKGLEILLQAMSLIRASDAGKSVTLDVYGDGADRFGDGFPERVNALRELSGRRVKFRGRYDQSALDGILAGVDAIVVPSTWWENSPLVISEAKAAGVKVICSDIGGMAEAVRVPDDGWHFRVGDAAHLAEVVQAVWEGTLERSGSARGAGTMEVTARGHMRLFERLVAAQVRR